ncbi:holothin acyltransferase-like [Parasteatoda tepidariorum]|uniref:holothin acyltransferase-like n=1 Tax=Parasteatoda tepidariorum TaxID=114398 RepID=UPI0039BC21D2
MGAPRTDYTLFKNETSCYVNYNSLSEDLPPGVALRPYQDDHLDLVSAYDYNLMGYDRRHLLELSSREENSQTFVALNGRECVGFGSVKLSCMGAARIGPLYADDATIAEALLKNLLKSFPRGRGIMMVTLSNNSKANNLMTKLSVPTTQELVQVFSERILEVDTHKVYAHFDVNFCVF